MGATRCWENRSSRRRFGARRALCGRRDGKLQAARRSVSTQLAMKLLLRPGMIRFERARNSDGQYAPEAGDESGITPETTASAYGAMGHGPGLLRNNKSLEPVAAGG